LDEQRLRPAPPVQGEQVNGHAIGMPLNALSPIKVGAILWTSYQNFLGSSLLWVTNPESSTSPSAGLYRLRKHPLVQDGDVVIHASTDTDVPGSATLATPIAKCCLWNARAPLGGTGFHEPTLGVGDYFGHAWVDRRGQQANLRDESATERLPAAGEPSAVGKCSAARCFVLQRVHPLRGSRLPGPMTARPALRHQTSTDAR
jgi:hypothetical protein